MCFLHKAGEATLIGFHYLPTGNILKHLIFLTRQPDLMIMQKIKSICVSVPGGWGERFHRYFLAQTAVLTLTI